jgi:hypothetical protein
MSNKGIISILSQLSKDDSIHYGKLGYAIKRLIIVKYFCSNEFIKIDNDVINILLSLIYVPIHISIYNTEIYEHYTYVQPLIVVSYENISIIDEIHNVKELNNLSKEKDYTLFKNDKITVQAFEHSYEHISLGDSTEYIESKLNGPILEEMDSFEDSSIPFTYTYIELSDMLNDKLYHIIKFNDIYFSFF